MVYNFKTGDYVVLNNPEVDYDSWVNETGVITSINESSVYPVAVKFGEKNGRHPLRYSELRLALEHEILEAKLLGL